jgi:hypothetical protein
MISRTRRRIALACLSLGLALGSCMDVTGLPSGSARFEAPAEYQLWWSMVESCSGLQGSLADVDWFVVPGSTSITIGDGVYDGYWFERGNRIVLAANGQTEGDLVRHEMLHALTRAGHTRNEFIERCGGIVNCETDCIRDAGPPAPTAANTPIVSPTTLEIGIEVQPSTPADAKFGGYFAIVVTARNPASHAVIVQLPQQNDGTLGVSFSYLLGTTPKDATGPFTSASDSSEIFFEPGETKRHAFDMTIADSSHFGLSPGTYVARGLYGDHRGDQTSFTVSP